MHIRPIKTERFLPEQDLSEFILNAVDDIDTGDVIAITSKIISLAQNRLIPQDQIDKNALILKEADKVLDTDQNTYGVKITIKDDILIASAGIDASNANGYYILYPQNIRDTTKKLWHDIANKKDIKDFGILVTDSHTSPLRRGITGFALSWYGFDPIHDYKGAPDIDKKPLEYSELNIVDSLAASAVLNMGEADEQCPIAIIKNIPKIKFLNTDQENSITARMEIPMEHDLYSPIFMAAKWMTPDKD
jgi:putative folate metabolism gamma-glutamate ligase